MNDSEIIRLVLEGDREVFRILVEKHKSMVFRTCMGFLHDKDDSDDLTQEISIQAYQSLQNFKKDASFSTWIYRIAVNASLNRLRKKNNSPILHRIDTYIHSAKEIETLPPFYDSANPESILISQENNKWVQNALDSLPDNQRTAIVLSKYDDLPQKKIAEIMKTTEGAVEALIQRAKANLRIKLAISYKKQIKTVGKI